MSEHVIRMPDPTSEIKLTRRELLKRSAAVSASMVVGTGFLASSNAAWAMEVKALSPETMATLVQIARDIFPHDRFPDELYAAAVKSHDDTAATDPGHKSLIEAGVTVANKLAVNRGHSSYVGAGWEADRLDILQTMKTGDFFQNVRGGLVVGLYNQPAVWEKLGYEGASFDKGGYLTRGFDDINWLS